MTDQPEMFSRFAVCHVCGAVVLNEQGHREFHDAIEKAFTSRDKAFRRALENAGLVRKKPRSARPDRTAHNVPGGKCRACSGILAEVECELPSIRSDHTVPYLFCPGCLREIRRG